MSLEDKRAAATRHSLIGRLVDWQDQARWQEFYDTYWRLIYSIARRAGLNDAEAHDVVQETVLSVARNIGRYDRRSGSFKSWLLQMARWRIVDQLRKRLPEAERAENADDAGRETATIDRLPAGSGELTLEHAWDEEWREQTLRAAMERVKQRVKPRHFQVFDCAVVKQWPVTRVASELRVNVAQVYLIRHRLGRMLKRELEAVQGGL